jgi:putative nucleotidyltransferase with HDIG domain
MSQGGRSGVNHTHSVLIVDDDPFLRLTVRQWVESFGMRTDQATSADEALERMHSEAADIAFCDVNMRNRSGIWLAGQIRERFPHTAIIMASAARDVDMALASLRNDVVDYLLKPFDRARLREAVSLATDWHRASTGLEDLQHALQDQLRRRRASVATDLAQAQDNSEDALETLIAMLQLHERDGRGHATRVARLALAIADQLGLNEEDLNTLEHGALLHDIGKLDMPAAILEKPAPLDDDEWRVMRTHPQIGYDLLRTQARFASAAPLVLAHHESYDGTGYPNGLRGDEIPYGARILSVADAYDSMTQPHTQRPAMPPSMATEEIERCSGHQFDPVCARALGPVLMSAAA